MTEKFDLERRAAELFRAHGNEHMRGVAIQLARELAEAIAAECRRNEEDVGYAGDYNDACRACAEIARSFARPRSREEVYREALERIRLSGYAARTEHSEPAHVIAARALDEAEKVDQS